MLEAIVAVSHTQAFGIGLVVTAYAFGLRHGIDWDHIAAITDITSSQASTRTAMFFATLYALGHASVVFVLGVLAITLGDLLPSGLDAFMERVVGVTLLVLGAYVFYALIRHGRDFRMRSRWMLIFSGVRRGARWVRRRMRSGSGSPNGSTVVDAALEHEHEHVPGTPHHESFETPLEVAAGSLRGSHPHRHRHRHPAPSNDDPFMNYGAGTSFVVGTIHGIGAETPTQVLIFLAATGVGGTAVGVLLLLVFLAGLLTSNTGIALAATYGFLAAGKSWRLYVAVAVVTGIFSLTVGSLFLLGRGTLLPAFFGG
ncbi:High-affinity nickel transport protein [bacterium HR12]|nr:High-affinity nickel transport protein [bacterium HR12]